MKTFAGKYILTRSLWIEGNDPKQLMLAAETVAKTQLKSYEGLICVDVKNDPQQNRISGTLFAVGDFPPEIAEKGIDKWTPTTADAVRAVTERYKFPYQVKAGLDDVQAQVFELIKKAIGSAIAYKLVSAPEWDKVQILFGVDLGARPPLDPALAASLSELTQWLDTDKNLPEEKKTLWKQALQTVLAKNTR